MVLGFGDAGLLSRLTFIGAGIGLAYCALFYGKRIRRLRDEAKSSPDIFE